MITRLTVTNFRAIRGTREYDELPPGVIAFIGQNEAGKSSSLLALAFAFYGAQAMPEGIGTDDLINDHAKECSVGVLFEHNGDAYALRRSQRRDGRGDADLMRNGVALASGRAPVTKAITELFGVDHVGFMVSVFARQDELDALAGKKGAERITTMLRLLGVDQIESAVKRLRKEAADERRRLDVLRASVPDLEELRARQESDRKALDDLMVNVVGVGHEVADGEATLRMLRDGLAALEPTRVAFADWQRKCDLARVAEATAKVRLTDAQGRIHVVPEEPQAPEFAAVPECPDESEVESTDAAIADCRGRWAAANGTLLALREELAGLTDSCAACGRPFDNAEQVAEHRTSLQARIAEAEGTVDREGQSGVELKSRRTEMAEKVRLARSVEEDNRRLREAHDRAVSDRQRLVEGNERAQAEIDSLAAEVELHSGDVARLAEVAVEDPTEQITARRAGVEAAQTVLNEARVRHATLTESIRGIEASLERVDGDLAKAQEKADEISEVEQVVLTLDVAAKEMAAMKERLIGRIIPALQERASAIVADLTDGKHTELRLTSDYEIQYVTETGGTRGFAGLSGGAQDVFALALRLAIAELRAGAVSFLVLDEVFESMDDERQGLAWEAIERLGKRYAQVFVITHVAGLKERARTVVAV